MFGSWLTDATVSKTLVWLLGSAFNEIKRRLAKAQLHAVTSSQSADTNLHLERVSFKSIHPIYIYISVCSSSNQ